MTNEEILKLTPFILQGAPIRWMSLTQNLPQELLSQRPAPNEWSAVDCLQHVVDMERWVFPVRVQAILDGQDFAAFDPDSQGTPISERKSAGALVADLNILRVDSLMLFRNLTVDDISRQARHEELGIVSLSELLHEWVGHDLMHMIQAERALMQPFIQGSGPWQRYFQDYVV
jgi:hypothetical protein